MTKIQQLLIGFILFSVCFTPMDLTAQNCADDANIFSFEYDNKTYHVVKENRKWVDAAACAVERGGKLVEINSALEQQAVFGGVSNASINLNGTFVNDFEEYAFVWLGGKDIEFEGDWQWDGDNDGEGFLFWVGTTTGAAVGGSYINWGNDPDNADEQDGLGMALTDYPNGTAGQWADLKVSNDIFYVIEYSTILDVEAPTLDNKILNIYPNPASRIFTIENRSSVSITSVEILDINGAILKTIQNTAGNTYEIGDLPPGFYLIKSRFETGIEVINKLVVQE